jgi:hypothetical protein
MYWVVESTLVRTRGMHPPRGDAPYLIVAATSSGEGRATRI